uniref:Radical SAM protein n=1 Tax=candidate division WOR-3 bacterium TaxID=2052148 RepID=A0A7C3Z1P9_UNCW3
MRCRICQREARTISQYLSLCRDCLKRCFLEIKGEIEKLHARSRRRYGLPEGIPKSGVRCGQCGNDCRIGIGERGYCGLIGNESGRLLFPDVGFLDFYFDPLPTNCVADWVCPGGTGAGFPKYAYRNGPEYGYKNLAVFFRHCSFNCLFCQNWHFREASIRSYEIEEILNVLDEKTACICYFGGDPTPNIRFALKLSERIVSSMKRIFRICWETNGSAQRGYIERMMELSLISGGILKIDFKAFSEEVSFALCGALNKKTKENIIYCAQFLEKREVPPPLVVSTLLVPGYIEEEEITLMAKFLSSINKKIPWALLAFAPQFYLADLPYTSRSHAERALAIAREYGMENVRIGNLHLLGNDY